jgi:anti-sigma B factor antagonist
MEKVRDAVVVTIPGETLEASITHDFKQDIAPILEEQTRVVFDMHQLRFVDSSGCGALLHSLRKVREKGGDLTLFGVSAQLLSLFKMIRLDRQLGIFDTKDDALDAFTS